MWLMVTFDLPVETKENKRDYRRFVDFLEDNGYSRIQYSIYVRPTSTYDNTEVHARRIAENLPPRGEVRVFRFTDKQWGRTACYHHGDLSIPEEEPQQLTFFDADNEVIVDPDALDPFAAPADPDREAPSVVRESRSEYDKANPSIGLNRKRRRRAKPSPDEQPSLDFF
jgi:CRISPR-associated protein Cas2